MNKMKAALVRGPESNMIVKIKYLTETAKTPSRKTAGAAAYDLYADETVYIPRETTVAIKTGLAMEIPEGWKGEIYSRSGLAYRGLVVANSPGKIDCDYRGEIMVLIHNQSNEGVACLEAGDRIAQFEVNPVYHIKFDNGELSDTERGEGHFGSTGK